MKTKNVMKFAFSMLKGKIITQNVSLMACCNFIILLVSYFGLLQTAIFARYTKDMQQNKTFIKKMSLLKLEFNCPR
jgi:hypothetical protein